MGLLQPTLPPYDPIAWSKLAFPARARAVCEAWAIQGYGTPLLVFGVYLLKIVAYVAGAVWLAGTGRTEDTAWWLDPVVFQKIVVWSLLFEVLGLGCGSGPLTGRYLPPVGGLLYFLRPGTTKLPLFPGVPLIGGLTRGPLEVLGYAALLGVCARVLVSAAPATGDLAVLVGLVAALGVLDKTVFLAARGEHYWTMLVCMVLLPDDWLPAAMAVQLALWFWAGVSKLNHHFPTVVAVMTSNGPLTPFGALRRAMYQDFPNDLRPSRLATVMAHMGTALEIGVPLAFVAASFGLDVRVGVVLMLLLHSYITSNVPMGVPLEWNVMVVYSGLFLFWGHPEVSVLDLRDPVVILFLAVMLIGLPLLSNFAPGRTSFLLGMRYYAGNWAWSVWLFRGDAWKKLAKLKKTSPWIYDQITPLYPYEAAVGLVGKVMAFRLMHLHGRALSELVPRIAEPLADYEWLDGELIAGMALGWNFGEGHLHHQQLLDSIQAQCGFLPGELRCVQGEAQPLFGTTVGYRLVDAASGLIEAGELPIAALRARQPWEQGVAG